MRPRPSETGCEFGIGLIRPRGQSLALNSCCGKFCGWDRTPASSMSPSLGLSCRSPLPCRRIQKMWIMKISSFTPTHWLKKPPALPLASMNIRFPPLTPWPRSGRYVTERWHLQSGKWEVGWQDAGVEVTHSCQRRVSRMKIRSCCSSP